MHQGQMLQWMGLPHHLWTCGRLLPSPPARPSVIICKKCGNRNEDRDQFCTSCGSFLEWSGERVAEAAPPTPEPMPAPVPPPPPPPPPTTTFIDQVKQRVGMESGQAAPPRPQTGGWVPPATVTPQPQPQPEATTGLPSARRPDAPAPDPEVPRARQPEEAPPPLPPTPRVMPAPVPDVNEVGTFCSNCGAGNDVRRHFCRRCGAPLMRGTVTNRVPWWQRLLPRRDPAVGDRPFREETTFGSLLRTFLLTMLLVVVLGGIFAYLALPGFRAAVNREIDVAVTDIRRLINPSYIQVHPVTTSVSSEVTGHPGQLATDLINNDYWAADMARDPQPTLTVTFDGATDLDALVVTNGAAGPDYPNLARARTLQISYSDGTGEQVTLKDVPQGTPYIIHARGVTSMTVRIVAVYPGSGSTSVGLAEIEFRRLA